MIGQNKQTEEKESKQYPQNTCIFRDICLYIQKFHKNIKLQNILYMHWPVNYKKPPIISTLWDKENLKMLLSYFCVGHLLLGIGSRVVYISSETVGRTNFSFVSDYQLSIASGLGMWACVYFL